MPGHARDREHAGEERRDREADQRLVGELIQIVQGHLDVRRVLLRQIDVEVVREIDDDEEQGDAEHADDEDP